jgi:hypothetical protein
MLCVKEFCFANDGGGGEDDDPILIHPQFVLSFPQLEFNA